MSVVFCWEPRLDTTFKNFTQICYVFRRLWAISCTSSFETKRKPMKMGQAFVCPSAGVHCSVGYFCVHDSHKFLNEREKVLYIHIADD